MSTDDRRILRNIEEKVEAEAKTMFYSLSQNFVVMAKHTLEFVELYENEIIRCTSEADELVHSTTNMIAKCEQLERNLESLEQLGSQASLMRKVALELEKKLDRVLR
mmetsp:Transcript_4840/g.9043  ORF Transcript_4840/g.9043 Transcript_4840/m.9043 type:complete len:107 (+) Transcript_4840:408-728(+)